ncbi:hypothetical protein BHM03_00003245 [Ensete ventricosum]|nr:hypothetical protein BHM03_00003245 [Ensete ventricosum]
MERPKGFLRRRDDAATVGKASWLSYWEVWAGSGIIYCAGNMAGASFGCCHLPSESTNRFLLLHHGRRKLRLVSKLCLFFLCFRQALDVRS